MRILKRSDLELINVCIKNELSLIEKGFENSEAIGKLFLQNAISSFKEEYLRKTYGEIVPSLSAEYRCFVVGILKNLKDEYKESAISAVLSHGSNVSSADLIKNLSQFTNVRQESKLLS